jgi:hypothetical protein
MEDWAYGKLESDTGWADRQGCERAGQASILFPARLEPATGAGGAVTDPRTGSGREPNLPVMGINRAPAHPTSHFVHIATLAYRQGAPYSSAAIR